MRRRCGWIVFFGALALMFPGGFAGFPGGPPAEKAGAARLIVASDTLLSGMIASLLPQQRYVVEAVLPPGQCPGHYDIKLTDIEKMKRAALVVSFRGMPFMDKDGSGGRGRLTVDTAGRNWMAPDAYRHGLDLLAGRLSGCFPLDRAKILSRRNEALRALEAGADSLMERIRRAGLPGKAVLASSMQKEPLEWMGLRVVGDYGRPEALSARDIVRLVKIGREWKAVAVVDNLQSGPDAGKGVAETLGIPHVVWSNFPSEKGYLATLGENMDALAAVRK